MEKSALRVLAVSLALGIALERVAHDGDAQNDQQTGRNDRSDHTPDLGNLADPRQSLQRDERSQPVDDEDNNERVILVIGQ